MTKRSFRSVFVPLGVIFALSLLLASTVGGAAQAGRPAVAPGKSVDARFADVGRAAPGFGGMFVRAGVLNVYLYDCYKGL